MTPKPITCNTLFYGDNLPILREHIVKFQREMRNMRAEVVSSARRR